MIHEPECLEVGYELDPSEFCSICITARAAYKRGREDAAKATELVGHVIGCGEDDNIWDYCACHSQSAYAAAARGDGAKDDRPECLDCESCTYPDCGCLGCGVAHGDDAE